MCGYIAIKPELKQSLHFIPPSYDVDTSIDIVEDKYFSTIAMGEQSKTINQRYDTLHATFYYTLYMGMQLP